MHFATKFCSIFGILLLACNVAFAATTQQNTPTTKKTYKSPEDITRLLQDAQKMRPSIIKYGPIVDLGKKLASWNQTLKQKTGLILGFSHTPLWQYASSSSARQFAGAGDFDFYGQWHIFNTSKTNPGSIGFELENRHHLASITPIELSKQIGAFWPTASIYNAQPLALIQLWWEQYLFDKHLMFRLGKIDQTDFFDANEFQTSELFYFNSALADNPAIAFPANGLGGIVELNLAKFYLTAGFGDVKADKTELTTSTFANDHEFFEAVELGLNLRKNAFGPDNYHITLWHTDDQTSPNKPSGYGFTVSAQHGLNQYLIPFARFAYSAKQILALKELFSGGIVINHPFNSKVSVLGFGAAYGIPNANVRSQYIAESFYRIQVTPNIQVTPDVQLIFNPLRSNVNNPVLVAGLRTRIYL